MPFYEYKCDTCGHQFEVMQRISDEPLTACEACGAEVRRLIFPSALVYKGSGFYSTEYGRSRFNAPNGEGKSESSTPSSESSSAADGAKSDTTKSETKSSTAATDGTAQSSPASSTGAS